jgi:type I restriction-modification system DNA methylase subunit
MEMGKLMGDQDHIRENLFAYVQAFSPAVRDIFERFDFATQIEKLAKSSLLYQVAEKFAGIDLHPQVVSNSQMGLAFEELIRKFAELSNETAGEHFTPREVIGLMLENDLLEAIIGLPTDMFYNTGISTYVWIVSNRKPSHRKGNKHSRSAL